jgi:hypothetical protein
MHLALQRVGRQRFGNAKTFAEGIKKPSHTWNLQAGWTKILCLEYYNVFPTHFLRRTIMKKLLVVFLCLVFCVGMVTSCAKEEPAQPAVQEQATPESAAQPAQEAEATPAPAADATPAPAAPAQQ